MLSALPLLITVSIDFVIFLLVGYYLYRLHSREKLLDKKENATDANYHHVVDDALSKERKILDDATSEASQIITGAEYVTHTSKDEVTHAIQQLVADIQKEGEGIARTFSSEYSSSLKQLTTQSLNEFQTTMTDLQSGLKKQIQEFHTSLLPEIEKELQVYKQARVQQIDQTVTNIIQKASQEIFNKSLSLSDHQAIVTESLEKAKKEGLFD